MPEAAAREYMAEDPSARPQRRPVDLPIRIQLDWDQLTDFVL
ncbi:hypothetical protein [Nocardia abscessus]|nr:hypothetical protein [Nocardia abscessus]